MTIEPEGGSAVASLLKYRALRAKWRRWMESDPNHSIWNQIFAMVSIDLAAQTIASAAENDPDSPLHNQLLVRVIVGGHRDAQILGIRRLMDTRAGSVSLGHLLKDIKKNLNVCTRENYISEAGLPYDNPAAPHAQFDRLSLVAPDQRKRTDRIAKRLIDHFEAHIDKSGLPEVLKWGHQFVAHAGDVQAVGWRDLDVTHEKAEAVQKSIAQVAQLTSWQILQGMALGPLVPIEQRSPFSRFEKLVNADALAKARQRRDELETDRNSWLHTNWGSPDLLTAIGWPAMPSPTAP